MEPPVAITRAIAFSIDLRVLIRAAQVALHVSTSTRADSSVGVGFFVVVEPLRAPRGDAERIDATYMCWPCTCRRQGRPRDDCSDPSCPIRICRRQIRDRLEGETMVRACPSTRPA